VEHIATITTRPSDFDPLGHVNNAVYLDYLEVLLNRSLDGGKDLKELMIQYLNEVPAGLPSVTVGQCEDDDEYVFSITSSDDIFTIGFLRMK
jgi:acyl-ACP thioesterase